MEYPIRINKYLRDKGLASRREADKLIEDGSVFINVEKAENGVMVNESDKIEVRGKQKENKYIAYYKPRGLATQDLAGKKSVVSEWRDKGLYPIGRLDKESEGLLLLTNDGRFVTEVLSENFPILSPTKLELQNRGSSIFQPNRNDLGKIGTKYEKEYIVTVKETLRPGIVRIFQAGMKTKSLGKLLPAKAKMVKNNTLQIILNEGKRHQIRVMLSEFNYTITSLKRIRIGNIKIGNLKPGETRVIFPS